MIINLNVKFFKYLYVWQYDYSLLATCKLACFSCDSYIYMYQIVSSLVAYFLLTSISYKGNHERPRRKNLPSLCWRDGFYWSAIEALQVWLRGSKYLIYLLLIKVLYFFFISFSSSNPFLDSLLSITNDRSSLSCIV